MRQIGPDPQLEAIVCAFCPGLWADQPVERFE